MDALGGFLQVELYLSSLGGSRLLLDRRLATPEFTGPFSLAALSRDFILFPL